MGSGTQAIDKANELLSDTTVCTHGFYNCIIAYMLQIAERTIRKIYVAWVLSMEAIFSHLSLRSDDWVLRYSKAEIFIKTGHGLTDAITELSLSYSNLATMILVHWRSQII